MALDAGRGEGGVARLEEHDAHDVVADVTLSLELSGERTSLLSSQVIALNRVDGLREFRNEERFSVKPNSQGGSESRELSYVG